MMKSKSQIAIGLQRIMNNPANILIKPKLKSFFQPDAALTQLADFQNLFIAFKLINIVIRYCII